MHCDLVRRSAICAAVDGDIYWSSLAFGASISRVLIPLPSAPAARSSFVMYSAGVDSSHTVCHIPVQGVYHIMPSRVSVCLPMGIWCLSVSVGSKACTSLESMSVDGQIRHSTHLQLVGAIARKMVCDIKREFKIPTPVKTCLFAIDKDGCFVINSTKVDQHAVVARPVRWNLKGRQVPTVEVSYLHDA